VIEPEIASGKGDYGKEGYGKGSKGKKGGYGMGTTRKLPYAKHYKTSKAKKTKTAKNISSEGTCPVNGEPCAIGEGTCKCGCYTGPGSKSGKGGDFEDLLDYGAHI
jgi:hypothetical protein